MPLALFFMGQLEVASTEVVIMAISIKVAKEPDTEEEGSHLDFSNKQPMDLVQLHSEGHSQEEDLDSQEGEHLQAANVY